MVGWKHSPHSGGLQGKQCHQKSQVPVREKDKAIFGEEVEGLGDYFACEPQIGYGGRVSRVGGG